jgi:VWFA-related protein
MAADITISLRSLVVALCCFSSIGNTTSGQTAHRNEKLVIVDAVVTDNKGDYIRDLSTADFHVLEGNREQPVRSVTRPAGAATAAGVPVRTVLFFGRIPVADQPYAREAALKFIESYAVPQRQVAILNYLGSGGIKVVNNFTADRERLMQAARSMEASAVPSSESAAGVSGVMSSTYSDLATGGSSVAYDVRSQLHALADLAKTMGSMPGRKAIVFLSPTINPSVRARTDPGSVGAGVLGSTIQPPPAFDVSYYLQPARRSQRRHRCLQQGKRCDLSRRRPR